MRSCNVVLAVLTAIVVAACSRGGSSTLSDTAKMRPVERAAARPRLTPVQVPDSATAIRLADTTSLASIADSMIATKGTYESTPEFTARASRLTNGLTYLVPLSVPDTMTVGLAAPYRSYDADKERLSINFPIDMNSLDLARVVSWADSVTGSTQMPDIRLTVLAIAPARKGGSYPMQVSFAIPRQRAKDLLPRLAICLLITPAPGPHGSVALSQRIELDSRITGSDRVVYTKSAVLLLVDDRDGTIAFRKLLKVE